MKYLKMTGLVAMVAMAFAAFAASPASATVLCKSAPSNNICPSTERYGTGTVIKASLVPGTNAVLTTSGGLFTPTVTCTASTTEGKTTNAGGAGVAVTGTMTALTFTGCTTGSGAGCTATAVHLPYNASISWTKEWNGTLTVTSSGKGNPGASVACEGLPTCEFTTSSAVLSVKGGNPAIAKAESINLAIAGGFGCPTEAHWTAEYEVLAPKPLFIEKE
jgi:hypothetical protein